MVSVACRKLIEPNKPYYKWGLYSFSLSGLVPEKLNILFSENSKTFGLTIFFNQNTRKQEGRKWYETSLKGSSRAGTCGAG